MVAPAPAFHAASPLHEIVPRDWAAEAQPIVSEIAARLAELDALRRGLGADLVFRLAHVYELSPTGFRILLDALAGGDLRRATAPLEQVAEAEERSCRQSMAYEINRAMRAIRPAFPHVAEALENLRVDAEKCHSLGEQDADDEVLHGARPSVGHYFQ